MTRTHLVNGKRCSHGAVRRLWHICLRAVDHAPQGGGYNLYQMASMHARFLPVAIASVFLVCSGSAFARTAACPCGVCTCAPCTCGGGSGGKTTKNTTSKTSKSESYHKGKDRHGEHESRGGVGVGVNIDLGGVGQRRAEPDPFAVGRSQPVARTQEKPKTPKKPQEAVKTNDFAGVELTGEKAKAESAPPSSMNVSNDEVEQPSLPPTEVFTKEKPKQLTKDDLQKGHDAHHAAQQKYLEKQPGWNRLVHDWTQSPNTEEGNKKSLEAKKKIDKLIDQFNQTDEGKKLIADWKMAHDDAVKSGEKVPNHLIPPPTNDYEKKKYAVAKAQNDLDDVKKNYDWKRESAARDDDAVKKAQKALSDSPAKSVNDPQWKELKANFDKVFNEAEAKWAASDEGKAEAKKVHEAEQQVEDAKKAYKPYQEFEEKPAKAASNP